MISYTHEARAGGWVWTQWQLVSAAVCLRSPSRSIPFFLFLTRSISYLFLSPKNRHLEMAKGGGVHFSMQSKILPFWCVGKMAGGHPRGLTHSHTLVVDLRKITILEGKRVGRKMNANQKTIFRKKEIKRKNSPCVLISSQNYEYEFRI
jgi:hypothetical protein